MEEPVDPEEAFQFELEEGYPISGPGVFRVQNEFFEYHMPNANKAELCVYLVLAMYCSESEGTCSPSKKEMAQRLGLNPRTIQRAWKFWEERGVIEIIPRYARSIEHPEDFITHRTKEYATRLPNMIRLLPLPTKREEGGQG